MIPVFVFVSLFIIGVTAFECENSTDLVPSNNDELVCYKLSNENMECKNDADLTQRIKEKHKWKIPPNDTISTEFKEDPARFDDFPLQVKAGSKDQWFLHCNNFTFGDDFEDLVSNYPFLRGIVVSAVGFRTGKLEITDETVYIGVANGPEFSTLDLSLNESWPIWTGNTDNIPRF